MTQAVLLYEWVEDLFHSMLGAQMELEEKEEEQSLSQLEQEICSRLDLWLEFLAFQQNPTTEAIMEDIVDLMHTELELAVN